MAKTEKRLDSFTQAYFDAALWSSSDESDESGGEPLDKNYSISDFAPETRDKMIADCADFQERFGELIDNEGTNHPSESSDELAGRDFWLTRNGHGAGFWNGDWPKNGDALTDAAKEYGEFYLYLGDPDEDGERMIYGPPEGAHGVREARGSSGTWGIWDATRQQWLPDASRGGVDNSPAKYKSKAGAEKDAKLWRQLNPSDRFDVKRWESGSVAPRLPDNWLPPGARESRHVADFNSLPDLIKHARSEGATHVFKGHKTWGDKSEAYLYFPRGDGSYEEAAVYRERGYLHVPANTARGIVQTLPNNAEPIFASVARRRGAAEARRREPRRRGSEPYDVYIRDENGKWRKTDPIKLSQDGTESELERALSVININAPRGSDRVKWYRDGRIAIYDGDDHDIVRLEPSGFSSEARESPVVRDYIAVDRNDRRVAGPFRSHGEAEQHVPPGGYVKFSSAQHRRAPPAPSSYPMFRAKEAGGRARGPKGRVGDTERDPRDASLFPYKAEAFFTYGGRTTLKFATGFGDTSAEAVQNCRRAVLEYFEDNPVNKKLYGDTKQYTILPMRISRLPKQ